YRVSASVEEPQDGSVGPDVVSAVCPQCGYQMQFGPKGLDANEPHASYRGDRIIVAKYPYEFADPRRFDVAVFKNPNKSKENYIKRVVGLPNETLVICKGDIFTTPEAFDHVWLNAGVVNQMQRAGQLVIARKPPAKVEAMLQVVHDNNYLAPRVPARWRPDRAAEEHWKRIDGGKGLEHDGQGGESWYSYRHLTLSPDDWRTLQRKPKLTAEDLVIEAELISDFYGYNTSEPGQRVVHGNHWVGDLAVECRLHVDSGEGEALLALVEGGRVFECRIDVATGSARLSISGDGSFDQTVATGIRGPGTHRVRFANIDDQLLLWVDGKPLAFDGRFGPLGNNVPNDDDLRPVRLGSRDAALRFTDIRVLRDVYYIAQRDNAERPHVDDYSIPPSLADPESWEHFDFDTAPAVDFRLEADQFLVLGDNSPASQDSRLWRGVDDEGNPEYYVRRDLLIGKAVFIYWPHGVRVFPSLWFPFYPNFGRMGLVR
ncbi:MAG TPA: signal peptidase I, partial [Pirellulales bacterium]|nr:signal peptidase I [Pirellulales bacterium]